MQACPAQLRTLVTAAITSKNINRIGLSSGTPTLALPQPASPDIHFAYDKDCPC